MGGPAWLGVGAQRSGTTWLTNLLCEHPLVEVPDGRKEQHELYRGLLEPWDTEAAQRYERLFDHANPQTRVGEWTPFYLMSPWAASTAASVLPDGTPVFAILRDPVERFESAVRYWLTLQGEADVAGPEREWIRTRGANALWAGMYATQLDSWAAAVGEDRLVVLQYEQVRDSPQRTVEMLWERLGLAPATLTGAAIPSSASSDQGAWSLDSVVQLRDQLRRTYMPEVARLTERWSFDVQLWANFR